MLLSAASVFVVAQSSSEIPEGRMNNPVCVCVCIYIYIYIYIYVCVCVCVCVEYPLHRGSIQVFNRSCQLTMQSHNDSANTHIGLKKKKSRSYESHWLVHGKE